jgi:hypothetical protein
VYDPGRVNINTINNPQVWKAVLNGLPGPTWKELVDSRRGYGGVTPDPNPDTLVGRFVEDAGVPDFFGNPFRAFGSGELVPLQTLERPEVEVTLLRSDLVGGTGGAHPPLTASLRPLMRAPSAGKYNNPDRNPYFRYQGLSHLSNKVTTRSNLYAVWITVGYFRVNDALNRRSLQNEIGLEYEGVERHRSFYVIDRSTPVAFEPGKNHNVDDAILLRRFLE